MYWCFPLHDIVSTDAVFLKCSVVVDYTVFDLPFPSSEVKHGRVAIIYTEKLANLCVSLK